MNEPAASENPPNIFGLSADRKGYESAGSGKERGKEEGALDELVKRAKEGDRNAFGELYRVHHSQISRVARFSLGSGAEDAVAETFCRAWASLPRYRETSVPFVAWLYGIARHVIADEIRRRIRDEKRGSHSDEMHEDPVVADRLDLVAALRKLPDEQRKIIEMKYLLGMKNPEVAQALGKSIGAVNAGQWRALNTLKKRLER